MEESEDPLTGGNVTLEAQREAEMRFEEELEREEEQREQMRASMVVPVNKEEMTIRNLDTGEEYLIGENEPDFEYNTYEIGYQAPTASTSVTQAASPQNHTNTGKDNILTPSKLSYFRRLKIWLWGDKGIQGRPSSSADKRLSTEKVKSPFSKLSSFKFRRELGRGAFGRVLLAESKSDGKLYAMKIMSKKGMRSSDRRQARAERDILLSMAGKSPHPFTTGLKFAFQSENNLYLGMDFLPGGNLKALIQRYGSLPEKWVRFFSAEMILALSHLHSLNVLYRDIKPHNIMLDGYGHIVLIDFGLSKQGGSENNGAMSLVGTPDYSAPEVLKTGVYRLSDKRKNKSKPNDTPEALPDHLGYGKPADWWSLGVMIYEMLNGKPPFRGRDLRETYKNVLFKEVKFPDAPYTECSAPDTDPLNTLADRMTLSYAERLTNEIIKDSTDPNSNDSSNTATDNATLRFDRASNDSATNEIMKHGDYFSQDAQTTLSGFLKRSPLSRLGTNSETYEYDCESNSTITNENSNAATVDPRVILKGRSGISEEALTAVGNVPRDILASPFFANHYSIGDWVDIYQKSIHGPWLPEPDEALVRKGFKDYALLKQRQKERRDNRRLKKELQAADVKETTGLEDKTSMNMTKNATATNTTCTATAALSSSNGETIKKSEIMREKIGNNTEGIASVDETEAYNGFEFSATSPIPTLDTKKRVGFVSPQIDTPRKTSTSNTPDTEISTPTAAVPLTPGLTMKSPNFNTPPPGEVGHGPPGHIPPRVPPPANHGNSISSSEASSYGHSAAPDSEVLRMRDSVLGVGRPSATIQDWSFVDENALADSVDMLQVPPSEKT